MFLGLVIWASLLKSGVHATLAGVIVALFIPNKINGQTKNSPLHKTESFLQPVVAFFVLPIFALANCAIPINFDSTSQFLHPVPLAISIALFIGKQVGVFGFTFIAIKAKWVTLPDKMNFLQLYGISVLCGIGFTMSLFIGSLAFDPLVFTEIFDQRIGVILGSILSASVGFIILKLSLTSKQ